MKKEYITCMKNIFKPFGFVRIHDEKGICISGVSIITCSVNFVWLLVMLCRLLPTHDIQAVVEGGCPNLLRKAVNSAKRLRAHLQLDEGDVRVLVHFYFLLSIFQRKY